jgi:hypothetical protein
MLGALLHLADVFDLRLRLSQMNLPCKVLTYALIPLDLAAAIGLYRFKSWGVVLLVTVAIGELFCFIGFPSTFGHQDFLIGFHLLSLLTLIAFYKRVKRLTLNP